jgi:hypothetical protein
MIECPACRRPTLSDREKLFLWPLSHMECPSCGAVVTVAWTAFIALLLAYFVALLLPVLFGVGGVARTALFVVCTVAICLFNQKCVPLIAKKPA